MLCLAGDRSRPCEDGVVVNIKGEAALFAVLDGVSELKDTALKDLTLEGKPVTGGELATAVVSRCLRALPPAEVTALEALERANLALQIAFENCWSAKELKEIPAWRLPACAAFVAVVNPKENVLTWAQAGDCLGFFKMSAQARVRVLADDPLRGLEANSLEKIASGSRLDDTDVQTALQIIRRMRNAPNGYALLDGNLNLNLCRHDKEMLGDAYCLGMISDGLYHCDEPLGFVGQSLLEGGLLHRAMLVQTRESSAGLSFPPRFKEHDDKAGIVVTFS